jgi:two-component system, cell cycle sensor histidine kinase and response regulator CckA
VASNQPSHTAALSDETFRALVEQAADGIFVSTDEGRFVEVNASGHRLLGYEPRELVGKTLADVLPLREQARLIEALAVVKSGQIMKEEWTFLRKDGSEVEAEVSSQRLGDGLVVAFVRELDQRRSYEIKVRHSEAQLRSILLTVPDVIMTVDRAGTISFINRVQPPLQPEDVIGSCAFDHVPPEARPRVAAAVEKVFTTRELDEYEVLGPPGPEHAREWWTVRAGPLIEGGEVVAATLCATNITPRKQSEEIEARLQEQLRQLQKLESIGRLAGGVAHDFNNLLTSILGFIDLARRSQPSGSPAIELLEGAAEAARRGATLTQQLLAFARKQIVHPTVVGIDQIIEGMTPMIRRLVGENLEVRLALAKTADKVKVDVGSLEQVIMNLVINARDAVVGTGRITLETGSMRLAPEYARDHDTTPGEHVFFAITDTGSGMSAEVAARAFEPFFTTKAVGKGTGLGLAMCEGIVRQAGGHITLDSGEERGSTFRVFLPRAANEPSVPSTRAEASSPVRGRETLLLVEDEPLILRMTKRVLGELGYTVLTASDGIEALEVLARHAGDVQLLITDVVMPKMSGRELAARVIALRPGIRVLYSSGYAADAIGDAGVIGDGINFLAKPYEPSRLADAVRDVLDR